MNDTNLDLEKYINYAGVIMVVIDRNQKVTLINNRGCELLGYKREEIIGKNWFDNFIPKAEIKKVKTFFNSVISKKIEPIESYENKVINKKGKERLVAWKNTFLTDEAGNITVSISSGEDITEKDDLNKKIVEEEKTLRSITDNISDAIVLTDLKLNIRYATLAAEKMVGYNLEELKKISLKKIMTASSLLKLGKVVAGELMNDSLKGVDKDRPATNIEIELIKKSGEGIIVEARAVFDRDEKGKAIGAIAVLRDVTYRKLSEEKKNKDQQLLAAVFEYSPLAMMILSSDFKVRNWNKAAEKMYGSTLEEVNSGNYPSVPEDKKTEALEMWHRATNVNVIGFETVRQRKDGSFFNVRISTAPLFDDKNKSDGFLAIVDDITEELKAKEKINREEEIIDSIFKSSPTALIALDNKCKIKLWNTRAEEIFGWSASEVIDKKIPFVPASVMSEAKSLWAKTLKGEEVDNLETVRLKKDGKLVNVSISTAPLKNPQGKITGFMESVLDITDAKKSKQETDKISKTIEAVFQASPLAVVALNRDFTVKMWNKAAEKMYGWTFAEVENKNYPSVPQDKKQEADAMWKQALEGPVIGFETVRQRKDGSLFDASISTAQLFKQDGTNDGFVGTIEDVTEKKKNEREIKKSNEQLEKFNQLMIGRELKMIELKIKNQELEKGISQQRSKNKSTTIGDVLSLLSDAIALEEDEVGLLEAKYLTAINDSSVNIFRKHQARTLIKVLIKDTIEHKNILMKLASKYNGK